MFGKRLINTGGAVCPSDVTDLFEDGSGVALYRLNSNADDSSGNYNGTATDVTYVSGHIDDAGSFNGSSSYVDTPLNTSNIVSNINDRTQDFTFSCWINTSSAGGDIIYLGNSFIHTPSEHWIGFSGGIGGGVRFAVYTGSLFKVESLSINDSNWHHIVGIRESSVLKLYLDNSFVGQTTQTADSSVSSGASLNLMASETPGNYRIGKLDQVRIFDRAITAAEVTTLYNEVAC